jgi:hypothetical protein
VNELLHDAGQALRTIAATAALDAASALVRAARHLTPARPVPLWLVRDGATPPVLHRIDQADLADGMWSDERWKR